MTDLPQLQSALVDAARRRRRNTRLRVTALAVLAAVAATLGVVRATGDVPREIPAKPPSALTPRDVADRFAVLRDPSRLTEPPVPFDDYVRDVADGRRQTYRVVDDPALTVHVTVADNVLCLLVDGPRAAGFGECRGDDLEARAAGRVAPVVASGSADPQFLQLVPDGTRDASVAYRDGTQAPVAVEDNLVVTSVSKPAGSMSWTTPEGDRVTFALPASRALYRRPPPEFCSAPALPLGPDALTQARAAGLREGPGLLNLDTVRVTDVYRATRPRSVGAQVRERCGVERKRRTVVVELREGYLFVARGPDGYGVYPAVR